ncbi:MAG TPA: porin, partial [Steroidobacteraceae bacterium]|nr:porin [Steroidobacteraceae bacterium]
YYVGPFGVLAEYVQSSQQVSRQVSASVRRSGQIDNSGWQTSFSYFLTGERELYNGLTPHSTFEPGKPGIGAWELVARYHELRIDPAAFAGGIESFSDPAVSARSARAFGVGLNWYLNQNIKWMLDFERTRFEGGAPADANRADENAFLTRFQLIF